MRVGLIFGGRSGEHEVSVVSARAVLRALEERGHTVIPMAIDREGRWTGTGTALDVLQRSGDRTDRVVSFEGTEPLANELLFEPPDVVFPVLHGPYGEDGTIQGLLETLELPYVGCGVAASAVCMDKILTKRMLRVMGLETPEWIELDRSGFERDPEAAVRACAAFETPFFVKPARLGSSVGITRVTHLADAHTALETAFAHDGRVIVEAGVDAREIEVAVLGNERPRTAVPGEVVPGHEFYDYADKYLDDACTLHAPAPLDGDQTGQARELALEAYRILGCEGMARVDLFLERETDRFFVNEINTIPGFTPISMFPKLWNLSGLSYPELVEELLALALARHGRRSG